MRTKVSQAVAVESDRLADIAYELADALQEKQAFTNSQMSGLENLAYTTPKVSDILDLVKTQIGRKRWPVGEGDQILDALSDLKRNAQRIVRGLEVGEEDEANAVRRVHLLLCREFVKHTVSHFLYARRFTDEGQATDG